jgi:hypothetical protein
VAVIGPERLRAADPRRGGMIGRRYMLPRAAAAALEQVFEEPVDGVIVIEHSRYAKLHRGVTATTRPNRILLTINGSDFVANPELLLHEYYHVLCQWRTGYLTRWRYVVECVRCGYWQNRYEQEAREFAVGTVELYLETLREQAARRSASPIRSLD